MNRNIPTTKEFYAAVAQKLERSGFPRGSRADLILPKEAAKALGCTIRGIPRYLRRQFLVSVIDGEEIKYSRADVLALVSAINSTMRGWARRLAWKFQKMEQDNLR